MACNVLCGAQLTQLCPCFFRLPLVGSMGPLDCYRPGGPRFAPAAITRIRIERARAEPQAAQCAFVALDAPSRRRGQCEKEFVTLLDLCVSSLRRGHANLLCIVPILTDDPRRESENCCKKCLASEPSMLQCQSNPNARNTPKYQPLQAPTHRGTQERTRHAMLMVPHIYRAAKAITTSS